MKIAKRSRWIILIPIAVVVLTMFATQIDSVRAVFSDMHMVGVLLRVESEIMQKTPAGQYYESLLWKHNGEIGQLSSKYPENNEKIIDALRLFAPALEALVNGDGDTVQITSEQVNALKAQLDFLASVGSPALKEDIEKEQQRLQLDRFVGMTMEEAWNVINMTWAPEPMEPPMLVAGSDGKWAYYVWSNVYFEYPGAFHVQTSETEKDSIYLVPSSNVPEQWNPCMMKVRIWSVPFAKKDEVNPLNSYSPESIVWESVIQNSEFPGVESISNIQDSPIMNYRAFQYNEENQIAVDIWVIVNENPFAESVDPTETIYQRYEYVQRMIGSLKIWKP